MRRFHSMNVSSRAEAALRRRSRGICCSPFVHRFLQIGLFGLLLAAQLHAAEIANLRNGFSIRHERHEVAGDMTRLYMSAEQSSGFVDVPTNQIESFEPAPTEPQA